VYGLIVLDLIVLGLIVLGLIVLGPKRFDGRVLSNTIPAELFTFKQRYVNGTENVA
jgi:hypothetical protein